MLSKEEWTPAFRFEDTYEVSTYGRVRNIKTAHIRKLSPLRTGYLRVGLYYKGKLYTKTVHKLVYESFKGELVNGTVKLS